MPRRTFTIEWPDEHGPLWMNTSNLLRCLLAVCPGTVFAVRDVTGDGKGGTQAEIGCRPFGRVVIPDRRPVKDYPNRRPAKG